MSLFRTSRFPLLVACAALALSGCMQTSGPIANAQRGDPDTLAYGELPAQPQPGRLPERGFFSRGNTNYATVPAQPATYASGESAPRVIMAETSAPPRERGAQGSGGLFAAIGLRAQPVGPAPMESNAQISSAPPPDVTAAVPVSYATPAIVAPDRDYRVDAGDKLRIVVFGQEGLTNTYAIDAGGGITMPLIGRVIARGMTPSGLAAHLTARLRKGYIREPSVAVEVEAYRPFFILGEVAAPGQYPYVPNMSVEAAVAIAGGFSPRARRDSVTLTHKADGGQMRAAVPLGTPINPGDTITVSERWF